MQMMSMQLDSFIGLDYRTSLIQSSALIFTMNVFTCFFVRSSGTMYRRKSAPRVLLRFQVDWAVWFFRSKPEMENMGVVKGAKGGKPD
ncbi:hypothetical protein RIF29_00656 [Crotalaria pallida]|uniref:Uncharacterized protein n=1 Tax=Crotalaria pallida TaxID=3830 RepID=A0AAN9IWW1_CROPI